MKIAEIKVLLAGSPTEAQLTEIAQDERKGVQQLWASYIRRLEAEDAERSRLQKMQVFEKKYYSAGAQYIAGIDEVGRGPLAGPLVMAAVILPPQSYLPHLDDSKKLSAARREALYPQILDIALEAVVTIVSPSEIDRLNIYKATKEGMEATLKALTLKPQVALVDAMHPQVQGMQIVPIIHGDALSLSIAAASVVAKVYRDRLMVELAAEYPAYGFAENKGYGSQLHMEALAACGATIWHRRSFEPVKSMQLEPLPYAGHETLSLKKPGTGTESECADVQTSAAGKVKPGNAKAVTGADA